MRECATPCARIGAAFNPDAELGNPFVRFKSTLACACALDLEPALTAYPSEGGQDNGMLSFHSPGINVPSRPGTHTHARTDARTHAHTRTDHVLERRLTTTHV